MKEIDMLIVKKHTKIKKKKTQKNTAFKAFISLFNW